MPKLAEMNICIGCTACAAACPKCCITMAANEDGFLYPKVNNEACVDCGLCEKACPILNPPMVCKDQPGAYAAYSKDETMRLESSSGGVFSELARAVLAKDGVVFGAAYNEQFDVFHICVENEAELARLRGAKYAQSDLGSTFTDIKDRLTKGQQVLFSGTPCQVAGLKAFLHKDHENLTTVDFVCHGVPSPMAWKEYVKYRAQQDNGGILPQSVNLRSKKTGWSSYRYSNLFRYSDGSSHAVRSGESLFMKLFVGDYINREACANCIFKGYSRCSDLTIGDFWGIWDIAPEMDDDKGTSVILCQSEHGAELLEQISDRLTVKQVMLEETSRHNGSMLISSPSNPRRREALDTIRVGNIADCESWFKAQKPTMVQSVKRIAGKLLHKVVKL